MIRVTAEQLATTAKVVSDEVKKEVSKRGLMLFGSYLKGTPVIVENYSLSDLDIIYAPSFEEPINRSAIVSEITSMLDLRNITVFNMGDIMVIEGETILAGVVMPVDIVVPLREQMLTSLMSSVVDVDNRIAALITEDARRKIVARKLLLMKWGLYGDVGGVAGTHIESVVVRGDNPGLFILGSQIRFREAPVYPTVRLSFMPVRLAALRVLMQNEPINEIEIEEPWGEKFHIEALSNAKSALSDLAMLRTINARHRITLALALIKALRDEGLSIPETLYVGAMSFTPSGSLVGVSEAPLITRIDVPPLPDEVLVENMVGVRYYVPMLDVEKISKYEKEFYETLVSQVQA